MKKNYKKETINNIFFFIDTKERRLLTLTKVFEKNLAFYKL